MTTGVDRWSSSDPGRISPTTSRPSRRLESAWRVINDLQAFVAASPAVIYTTTQTSDGFACRFVSENLKSIMGYLPWEMRDNPKFWAKHVHPEDARVCSPRSTADRPGRRNPRIPVPAPAGRLSSGSRIAFRVAPDKEGKPKEIVGSWADISDRKRYRGRAAATCQGGRAAQPIHSRDLWSLPDG